jgi:hypothetical protein
MLCTRQFGRRLWELLLVAAEIVKQPFLYPDLLATESSGRVLTPSYSGCLAQWQYRLASLATSIIMILIFVCVRKISMHVPASLPHN